VARTAATHSLVSETIVVNDGSEDNTSEDDDFTLLFGIGGEKQRRTRRLSPTFTVTESVYVGGRSVQAVHSSLREGKSPPSGSDFSIATPPQVALHEKDLTACIV
jgi:hypothetical protein